MIREVTKSELEDWKAKSGNLRQKATELYRLGQDAQALTLISKATRYEVSVELVEGKREELRKNKKVEFVMKD